MNSSSSSSRTHYVASTCGMLHRSIPALQYRVQHWGMPLAIEEIYALTYKHLHIQVGATKEANTNEMPLRGTKRGTTESALDAVIHARADDYCR